MACCVYDEAVAQTCIIDIEGERSQGGDVTERAIASRAAGKESDVEEAKETEKDPALSDMSVSRPTIRVFALTWIQCGW